MPKVNLNFSSAGTEDLLREIRTLSANLETTRKSTESLGKSFTQVADVTKRISSAFNLFGGVAKSAMGFLTGREVINAAAKFQKNLYDISRTASFTGQSLTDLRRSIDDITKSTELSKNEAATFVRSLQDQTKGVRLTGKQISALSKTLTEEFGPSLREVQEATADLMKIQQHDMFILERLHDKMKPEEIVRYGASLVQLGKITEKEYRTLIRASDAFKGLHDSMEDKRLRAYDRSVQNFQKSWENFRLTIGTPVIKSLTSLLNSFSKIISEGDKFAGLSKTIQKAFEFAPIIAGVYGLIKALQVMNAIKLATGISSVIDWVGGTGKRGGGAGAAKIGGIGTAAAAAGPMAGRGMLGGLGVQKLIRGAVPVFVVNQQMLGGVGEAGEAGSLVRMEERQRRIGRENRRRIVAPRPTPTFLGRTSRRIASLPGKAIGLVGQGAAGTLSMMPRLGRKALLGAGMMGLAAGAGQMAGGTLRESGQQRLGAGVEAGSKVIGGAAMGASIGSMIPVVGTAIGAVVGGIGGLVTSLDSLKETFPELAPLFKEFDGVMKTLGEAFGPVIKAAKDVAKSLLEPIKNALKDLMPNFKSIALLLGGTLAKALEMTLELLAPFAKIIGSEIAFALKLVTPLLELFLASLRKAVEYLEPLVDLVTEVFKSIADAVVDGLNKILEHLNLNKIETYAKKGGKGERGAGETQESLLEKRKQAILSIATKEGLPEKLSRDFEELKNVFENTFAKSFVQNTKLEKLSDAQAKTYLRILKSIENVEEIMGVDRGQKNEFIAAAASLEAMKGYLKKQNIVGEQANKVIDKALTGRLADVGMAAGVLRAGKDVTPEQAGAARQQFAAPLGAKDMKDTEIAANATALSAEKIRFAFESARIQAIQLTETLNQTVEYNKKISEFMSMYKGDTYGAVAQVEKNLALIEHQVNVLKMAKGYRDALVGTEGTEEELLSKIGKLLRDRGTSEEDVNKAMMAVGAELSGQIQMIDLINQKEVERVNTYLQMGQRYAERGASIDKEVSLLEAEMELTKAMYLGLGPTLDMQIQIVNKLEERKKWVEKELQLVKEQQKQHPGSLVYLNKARELQQQKVDLTRKELEITKNLREGYLDAMQAFTNVEGFFSKIILKQDYGMGEMLRQFGASGGFRVGAIGAGGNEPFARWTNKGQLQWGGPEEMQRRARGYDDQFLPVPGAVNVAAAVEGGGMGDFFRAQEMLRQTGLPQMGQQVGRGIPTEDLFRKAIEGSKQESPLVRAQLQSQFKDLTEKEKLTRERLEQDPENVTLRKELASIEGEKKQVMERAQGPQGMSMGECCDKLSSRLDKIIEILSGSMRAQGTSAQGPAVAAKATATGPEAAVKPIPGVSPVAPVAGAASATPDPELEKMRVRKKEVEARIGQLKGKKQVGPKDPGYMLTPLTKEEEAERKNLEAAVKPAPRPARITTQVRLPSPESFQEVRERIRQAAVKETAATAMPVHKEAKKNKVKKDWLAPGPLLGAAIDAFRERDDTKGQAAARATTTQKVSPTERTGRPTETIKNPIKQVSYAIDYWAKVAEKKLYSKEQEDRETRYRTTERARKDAEVASAKRDKSGGILRGEKSEELKKLMQEQTDLTKQIASKEEAIQKQQLEQQQKTAEQSAKQTDAIKEQKSTIEKDKKSDEKEAKFESAVEKQYKAMEKDLKEKQVRWEGYFNKYSTDAVMQGVNTTGAGFGRRGGGGVGGGGIMRGDTGPSFIFQAEQPGQGSIAGGDTPMGRDFRQTPEYRKAYAAKLQAEEIGQKALWSQGLGAVAREKEGIAAEKAELDQEVLTKMDQQRQAIENGTRVSKEQLGVEKQSLKQGEELGREAGKGTKDKNLAAGLREAVETAVVSETEGPVYARFGGLVRQMQSGGIVPGQGRGDKIPALLEPGEFVMPREATMKNLGALMQIRGYQHGGPVVPPRDMAMGGGGFSPKFAINVRGDSVKKILNNVNSQLAGLLNTMLSPSGTSGRLHDLPQSG